MSEKLGETVGEHWFSNEDLMEKGEHKLFRRNITPEQVGQPLGSTVWGLGLRSKFTIQNVLKLKVGEKYDIYTRTR